MPSGVAVVTFGATPSRSQARLSVAGQVGILSSSLVEAWVYPPGGTVDHSEDEHVAENLKVNVQNIVPGVGFDIVLESILGATYGAWQLAWAWR